MVILKEKKKDLRLPILQDHFQFSKSNPHLAYLLKLYFSFDEVSSLEIPLAVSIYSVLVQ